MTTDWVAGKEQADYNEMIHQLKEIVETWQAVMLYSSAGFTAFTEIPDLKLQWVSMIVFPLMWAYYWMELQDLQQNYLVILLQEPSH